MKEMYVDYKERERERSKFELLVVIKGSYPPSAAICSLFFPPSSAMLLSSKATCLRSFTLLLDRQQQHINHNT